MLEAQTCPNAVRHALQAGLWWLRAAVEHQDAPQRSSTALPRPHQTRLGWCCSLSSSVEPVVGGSGCQWFPPELVHGSSSRLEVGPMQL